MYPIEDYLSMLNAADRAPRTIQLYRSVFRSYAGCFNIPLAELHNHISPQNLISYAASQKTKDMSGRGIRQRLTVLRAYCEAGGMQFDRMQMKVLTATRREDVNDKPLSRELLVKMMDLADAHGRAIITFLVSTGIRAGEMSKLLLSDVDGDVVTIRDAVSKGRRGGRAYLTAEAREYLDLWLRERDEYIELAKIRTRCFGWEKKDEDLLFACSYNNILVIFSNLYRKADGEKGKYGNRITPHSCRKFFRTQLARSGETDMVEHLMRHEGYLTQNYRRVLNEDARKFFHENERFLYITRKDARYTDNAIEQLKLKNKALEEKIKDREGIDAETSRRLAALERIVPRMQRG